MLPIACALLMEEPLLPTQKTSSTDTPPPPSPPPSKSTATNITLEFCAAPSTNLTGLTFLFLVACISLYANHEASKGFEVTVLAAPADRSAGRLFDLFFASNGRGAQIVLNASNFVERNLYPDESFPRKPVHSVTLCMATQNLTDIVSVNYGRNNIVAVHKDFTILVSPGVMLEANPRLALAGAVQRAMAWVWLWEGQGRAPMWLMEAVVEYLSLASGFPHSLDSKNPVPVQRKGSCFGAHASINSIARFFQYCEQTRHGFIARLNAAMREEWNEQLLDLAWDPSSHGLCAAYQVWARQQGELLGPVSSV